MMSLGVTVQVTWNWCVGRNENFREILHEYYLISRAVTPKLEFFAKLSILTTILGVISELFCYLMFFRYLHENNKKLFTKKS